MMVERNVVARIILLDVMRSKGVEDCYCLGCERLAECRDFRESINRGQSMIMCADFKGAKDDRYPECSRCRQRYTTERYDFCRLGGCSATHRRCIRMMAERKGGKI